MLARTKKLMAMVLTVCLVMGFIPVTAAAGETPEPTVTSNGQVVTPGSTVHYARTETGVAVTQNPEESILSIQKTVAGTDTENVFDITLKVSTTQNIQTIPGKTPDSAVVLVLDVSNSMDDCAKCGKEQSHGNHHDTFLCSVCEKTESDSNHDKTWGYFCDGTNSSTGKVYEKKSNNNCKHCGKKLSEHTWGLDYKTPTHAFSAKTDPIPAVCAYEARLVQAKAAANSFIDTFATGTGAQEGDKRLVQIVAFGANAHNYTNQWYDVNDTTNGASNITALKDIIGNGLEDGIKVSNAGRTDAGGGSTNIEGALMLARNILNAGKVQGKPLAKVDYLYTVLLTDGTPTYNLSGDDRSTILIKGTGGGGGYTTTNDVKDVPTVANAIKAVGGDSTTSMLFSICYGKTGNNDADWVYNQKTFDNVSGAGYSLKDSNNNNRAWSDVTVGEWLTYFSNKAFKAGDKMDLFDVFESISKTIELGAKAWRVEDKMGEDILYKELISEPGPLSYTVKDGVISWNLKSSSPTVTETGPADNKTKVYTYTMVYRVQLDNIAAKADDVFDTNAYAKLEFILSDDKGNWPTDEDDLLSVNFPVPAVKAMFGSASFLKTDEVGTGLDGLTFTLDHASGCPCGLTTTFAMTAKSATVGEDKGVVTFANLPSGHQYTITEAGFGADEPNYDFAGKYTPGTGNITATVSFGKATFSGLNESGAYENARVLPKISVTKTITKEEYETWPVSLSFTFVLKNSKDVVVATAVVPITDPEGNSVTSDPVFFTWDNKVTAEHVEGALYIHETLTPGTEWAYKGENGALYATVGADMKVTYPNEATSPAGQTNDYTQNPEDVTITAYKDIAADTTFDWDEFMTTEFHVLAGAELACDCVVVHDADDACFEEILHECDEFCTPECGMIGEGHVCETHDGDCNKPMVHQSEEEHNCIEAGCYEGECTLPHATGDCDMQCPLVGTVDRTECTTDHEIEHKADCYSYTFEFDLEKKNEDGTWTQVQDTKSITLTPTQIKAIVDGETPAALDSWTISGDQATVGGQYRVVEQAFDYAYGWGTPTQSNAFTVSPVGGQTFKPVTINTLGDINLPVLTVSKQILNARNNNAPYTASPVAESFLFELTDGDQYEYAFSIDGIGTHTIRLDAFINATATLTLSETVGSTDGMTYASPITIEIVNGKIVSITGVDSGTTAVVNNTYHQPITPTIGISKTTNGTANNDTFSFNYWVENTAGGFDLQVAKTITTVDGIGSETITLAENFSGIVYVSEAKGTNDKWIYDETVYRFAFDDGVLTGQAVGKVAGFAPDVEIIFETSNEPTNTAAFRNEYYNPALTLTKTADKDAYTVGDTMTYTLTASLSDASTEDVKLAKATDTRWNADTKIVSVTFGGTVLTTEQYTLTGNEMTFTGDFVFTDKGEALVIVYTIEAQAAGTVENVANVYGNGSITTASATATGSKTVTVNRIPEPDMVSYDVRHEYYLVSGDNRTSEGNYTTTHEVRPDTQINTSDITRRTTNGTRSYSFESIDHTGTVTITQTGLVITLTYTRTETTTTTTSPGEDPVPVTTTAPPEEDITTESPVVDYTTQPEPTQAPEPEEEVIEVPDVLADLPATGVLTTPVDPIWTLGTLAVLASMGVALKLRKKEEQE